MVHACAKNSQNLVKSRSSGYGFECGIYESVLGVQEVSKKVVVSKDDGM